MAYEKTKAALATYHACRIRNTKLRVGGMSLARYEVQEAYAQESGIAMHLAQHMCVEQIEAFIEGRTFAGRAASS